MLKEVPGFDKYLASDDGEVYSKNYNHTGQIKKLQGKLTKDGYIELLLRTNDGKRKYIRKHIIIARTFIPNPNNLPQVNHEDGNKLNCAVDNLKWCTQSYNIQHAFNTGLNHTKSVIQYKDGIEVARYNSIQEASRKTGCYPQAIWKVLHHKMNTTKGFYFEFEKGGDALCHQ